MKLLGWMHRKFRQNSCEPIKDLFIGHSYNCLSGKPSPNDQQYYQKPNCGNNPPKQTRIDSPLGKPFSALEAAQGEENNILEESSATISDIFDGFLAIGTLGSDPSLADPSTPTLAYSFENITEKDAEVTEDELKLINDELEKVLAAEAKEDCFSLSSGRNSHVSTGRSSHASTITLSGKPILERRETFANGSSACPLKEYLLGSSISLTETSSMAKKERRTSLGELFQMSKITEDGYDSKCEKEEKCREGDKPITHLMKKNLVKKMMLAFSKGSTAAAGASFDSTSETKLPKILHLFHRKVHPEDVVTTKKSGRAKKNNDSKKKSRDTRQNSGNRVFQNANVVEYPQSALANPPEFPFAGNESNGNRECWIKTDADYLVLEL